MNKTSPKRGRPPKGDDRVKADYLDIRLLAAEKQAFRDAADLAGLDLSAWVRERLRLLARKELEAADRPVAFLAKAAELTMATTDTNGRAFLMAARFIAPSSIRLQFSDKTFVLPVKRLEMPCGQINWRTAKASKTGEKMTVKGVKGGEVPIDSATLRYLVDKDYAAKVDQSISDLHMTPAEAKDAAKRSKRTRDPRWNDVGKEDDLFE